MHTIPVSDTGGNPAAQPPAHQQIAPTPPEHLTILRSRGPRLTKLRNAEGWHPYENAALFAPSAVPVASLSDVHSALAELRDRPTWAVIRGEPISNLPGYRPRRLHAQGGEQATFRSAPRQWVMLDIDAEGLPADLTMLEPESAALWVRDHSLSPEFKSAGMVWQASSRAGEVPTQAKLHLWFWFDRPVSDAELRNWLKDSPVDLALFNAIQLHYTADPIFEGVADPMRGHRLGLVPGPVVVVPQIDVPAPRPRPVNAAMLGQAPDRVALRCLANSLHRASGVIGLGRDALRNLLEREPFAETGRRDSALFGLACVLVEAFPAYPAASVIGPIRAELVRQSDGERWAEGDAAAELEAKMVRLGGA